jgi:hypothetical protein
MDAGLLACVCERVQLSASDEREVHWSRGSPDLQRVVHLLADVTHVSNTYQISAHHPRVHIMHQVT